ncbi:hypothetical protein ACWGQ5_48590 [Streptomyces sp. NPDC055722]
MQNTGVAFPVGISGPRTDPHAEGGFVIEEDTAPQYLSPWERDECGEIPPGGTWIDADRRIPPRP